MRFGRILTGSGPCYVRPEDDTLVRLSGDPFEGPLKDTGETIPPHEWLAPIEPRAILCIGKNYLDHIREFDSETIPDHPVVFSKYLSAATGHDSPIHIPAVCEDEIDYEAELAVVIGKKACNVPDARAMDYVLGYTTANDVSARIWQKDKGGGQWNRGKGFDTFAPMGPWLVTPESLPNPQILGIRSRLNGETMQEGNTELMMYPVARIIAFLSQGTTLLPGTVILTGTPAGVGWARDPKVTLKPGDIIEVEIDGIGTLRNPVVRHGQ